MGRGLYAVRLAAKGAFRPPPAHAADMGEQEAESRLAAAAAGSLPVTYGSWAWCPACHIVHSQRLVEKMVHGAAEASQPATQLCLSCQGGRQNCTKPPQVSDLPRPVRGLADSQWRALAVLRLSQGEPVQHPQGYKRRDKMSTLSWAPTTPEAAVVVYLLFASCVHDLTEALHDLSVARSIL